MVLLTLSDTSYVNNIVRLLRNYLKSQVYNMQLPISKNVNIDVEYCGVCDYGGHCLALAGVIKKTSSDASVTCTRGRQGSFEVKVNNKLVYSKLQTMALPDYEEVADVVNEVTHGAEPREIKGQQPINCVIS